MPSAFVESNCLPFLLDAQNADGGWGFHARSVSRAEPTAWALIALLECSSSKANEEAANRASDFLGVAQLPDGSWPSSPELKEGSWVTSLACLALIGRNESSRNVLRGLDWLSKELPGETGPLRRILRLFLAKKSVTAQNESYFGWSWTAGTASWVEPTSYAIIFMRAIPTELLSKAAKRRLRLADAMLFDRMCPFGGWNCGNPMVYGVPGEPQMSSTAWALLALRGRTERPEVRESLSWLEENLKSIQSPVSLALALLVMNSFGRPDAKLADSLKALYTEKEFQWNVPEVAWIALALSDTQRWLVQKAKWSESPNGTDC